MLHNMAIPDAMLRKVMQVRGPGADGAYRDAAGLTAADALTIVEIACMVVAVDGHIESDELAAVRVLGSAALAMAGVEPSKESEAQVNAIADRCATVGSREERLERLAALAESLTSEDARRIAYKATVATSMADMSTSDEEFEFDIDLLDALHLSDEVGDRLAGEVHEALTPDDV